MTGCGRAASTRSRSIPVDPGSGNVFVDLGLADAGGRAAKVALAVKTNRHLKASGLSQTAAARLLGVNQTKISALADYCLEEISVGLLMSSLTALGRDLEITIRAKRSARAPGRIVITEG